VGPRIVLGTSEPDLKGRRQNRSYAFEGGWYFALEPMPGGRTRLLARTRVPHGLPSLAYAIFIELPHFIMERKMLLGIKWRAEHATTAQLTTR
jgi:hypothetical protein